MADLASELRAPGGLRETAGLYLLTGAHSPQYSVGTPSASALPEAPPPSPSPASPVHCRLLRTVRPCLGDTACPPLRTPVCSASKHGSGSSQWALPPCPPRSRAAGKIRRIAKVTLLGGAWQEAGFGGRTGMSHVQGGYFTPANRSCWFAIWRVWPQFAGVG